MLSSISAHRRPVATRNTSTFFDDVTTLNKSPTGDTWRRGNKGWEWGQGAWQVMRHLNALAESLGLGEIVEPSVTFELERHAVRQGQRDGIPQLQHAGCVSGDDGIVRGSGVHAHRVTCCA